MRRGAAVGLGLAALALAFAGGAGAAWYASSAISTDTGIGPGGWRTGAGIGSANQSMLSRATIARVGIWALPPSEVIYFSAVADDAGRKLDPRCTYLLVGKGNLPARWWSIGVYVGNHWADNPANRYTYTSTSTARTADGGYEIVVSRHPQPGNWLPLGARDGGVTLTTRLYQPAASVGADPMSVPLPAIRRLKCA